uniref:Uncharacterized protein n=1 Tax=Pyramimonas obovata TaxID=1411642 RepID=A0A7S0WU54_9CHLO
MSDAVKLGGTSDAGATKRKALSGAAGMGEGRPMAQSQAASAPQEHIHQHQQAPGGPRSKSATAMGGDDGRGYAGNIVRAQMNQAEAAGPQKVSFGPKCPDGRSIFEFPPVVEQAFERNWDFAKRVFSPSAIIEPLPLPLKTSISRTFSFFNPSRLFDANETRKALGLGSK